MFTGTLPSEHGIHTHNLNFGTVDRSGTLLGQLPHRAISVSANEFTTPEFGFDGWFDECLTIHQTKRLPEGLDVAGIEGVRELLAKAVSHDHPLKSIANGIFGELFWATDNFPIPALFDQGARGIVRHATNRVADSDEPVFLFTNFMEAHLPHRTMRGLNDEYHSVPHNWSSTAFDHWKVNTGGSEVIKRHHTEIMHFRELYAASVEYLDRRVCELIDKIQAVTDRETSVVVTADHGENLGYEADRYLFGHTSSLTEGLLHVPLLIVNPPEKSANLGSGYLSHLTLPDLLENLADGVVPSVSEPRIPAELLGGGTAVGADDEQYWDRALRSVYDYEESRKWVWDSLDTTEQVDLDASQPCWQSASTTMAVPEWTQEFFTDDLTTVKRKVSSKEKMNEMSDSTAARLSDLGYL
jgi:arylsulfatase A-like enzyme